MFLSRNAFRPEGVAAVSVVDPDTGGLMSIFIPRAGLLTKTPLRVSWNEAQHRLGQENQKPEWKGRLKLPSVEQMQAICAHAALQSQLEPDWYHTCYTYRTPRGSEGVSCVHGRNGQYGLAPPSVPSCVLFVLS